MQDIVVIGAGVAGLTSALLLARSDKPYRITVVARHMPGDYDIEYTSPWAGANYLPMSTPANARWERATLPELYRLAADVPEAGVHFQDALLLRRHKPGEHSDDPLFADDPWFRTTVRGYRELPAPDVPPGFASAATFQSVCINPMLYLPWLVGQCRRRGVVFRRAVLGHVGEAAQYAGLAVQADGTTGVSSSPSSSSSASSSSGAPPPIIVNCSGLLACRLGGVMDTAVQPARGQTVVLRDELAPMLAVEHQTSGTGTDDNNPPLIYSMLRAAGGGTVVGGTYQIGNWAALPDANTASRLLAEIAATHPQLRARGVRAQDLDVVRHAVGLRPYRAGGVRLAAERIEGVAGWVVHNYGHAGWGYQGSYGCAARVVELVEGVVVEGAEGEASEASEAKL